MRKTTKTTPLFLVFLGLMVFLLPACVPFVDLYIASDVGYQKAQMDKVSTTDTSSPSIQLKGDGIIYGGSLGLGLSALRLYTGVEIGAYYSSVKLEGMTSTQEEIIREKWMFNAAGDLGFYVIEELLLFGRASYIYLNNNLKRIKDIKNVKEDNSVAFGGGLEYEIGAGLGVRSYYLYHTGKRKAHDVRAGIIWRF